MSSPLLVAAALLATGPAATVPTCPGWESPERRLRLVEARLLALTNERRLLLDQPPLGSTQDIEQIARAYAELMARVGSLDHHLPPRRSLERRLLDANVVDWDLSGENIAMASVVKFRAWDRDRANMSVGCHDIDSLAWDLENALSTSPGHRENLLSSEYSSLGVGAAYRPATQSVFIAQVFIRRVSCGYRGGPCCQVPLAPGFATCLEPALCSAGVCEVANLAPESHPKEATAGDPR